MRTGHVKIPEKFSNVLKVDNFYKYKCRIFSFIQNWLIGNWFFFNHCLKVCHFTNTELEKNSEVVSKLFVLGTFENFFVIFTRPVPLKPC